MNYAELAARLQHLAERLSKYAGRIEGESMGRSAQTLSVNIARFEESLEGYLASRKSGELLLETLLRSPAAKRHLTLDMLKSGTRRLTGKRLKTAELRSAKREFVERIHEAGKHDEAAKFLREAFAEAIHLEPRGKDKASLQHEFFELGKLAEDEFAREVGKRSLEELGRLAETNGIKFTEKTTRQRLAALIRRYAQRAVFNLPPAA